jgi:hypothetical protein
MLMHLPNCVICGTANIYFEESMVDQDTSARAITELLDMQGLNNQQHQPSHDEQF